MADIPKETTGKDFVSSFPTFTLPSVDVSDSSDDDISLSSHASHGLFPFKLWYFSSFAGFACIGPFLVLYYHKVGLSLSKIGLLMAMQPFVSIPMGAFWGMLVDWSQKPKSVLILTIAAAAVCRFSIGWASQFWALCLAVGLSYAVGSPSSVLADVLTLQALPDKADYGKIRLWGAVGWGAMSPLAGLLIKVTDLHSIFYCHLALMAVCLLVTCFLPVDSGKSEDSNSSQRRVGDLLTQLRQLFSCSSVVVFFLVVVVMGAAMGSMSSFVFLYLEELGGDAALMGLTLTVMCVAEIPAMYLSSMAVRRFGVVNVLCIVLLTYVIRLVYYSFLRDPWLVLPIELLHGITFGWGFAVGTMHAGEIAPRGLAATTQGLFNVAFFNVGSGLGSLISGFIYDRFGAVFMFRSAACGVLSTLLFFIFFNCHFHKEKCHEEDQAILSYHVERTI